MSSARTYLGRVREVRTSFGAHRYALIEPLIQSDELGYQWTGSVTDVDSAFPTRGRVHWYGVSPSVERGQVWQFETEERPVSANGEKHADQWQVRNERQAVEIIDLRGWDEDQLRTNITSGGVPLDVTPLTRDVALWLDDDHVLGPVRLIHAEDQRSWVLETRDLSKLPVRRISEDGVNAVECDGARWLLNPQLDWGSQAGIRNWSSDDELARTILSRLRRYNASTVQSLVATTAIFDLYLKTLSDTGFFNNELTSDPARLGRVKALRNSVLQNHALIIEASAAMLDTPEIRERVDRSVEEEVQRRIAVRKREIDEALVDQAAALEEVGVALNTLEERHAELTRAVREREDELTLMQKELDADFDRRIAEQETAVAVHRTQIDQAIDERRAHLVELEAEFQARSAKFEAALAERILELVERPEAAFADIAVVGAALRMGIANVGTARTSAPMDKSTGAVTITSLGSEFRQLATRQQLQSTLMEQALRNGIHPMAALECHAACLAGGLPVLLGDRVEALIDAYAGTVSGGRVTWVPVGASVLDPHHLLGSVDVPNHRFVAHANGLARLLLGAQHSPDLHLVVFDGINRAPTESWLLPFLHAMSSARRGRMERGIPLIAPGIVTSDDPFADATRLQWPRNVIPVGIAARGSATLPLPPELWRFGALIDVDRVTPSIPTSTENSTAASRVSADHWFAWQDAMSLVDQDTLDAAGRLIAGTSEGSRNVEIAGRMATILRSHDLRPELAQRHALIPTVVPRLVGDESVLERLGTASGLQDSAEWRAVFEAATSLAQ